MPLSKLKKPSAHERKTLGSFLASRRARLKPTDLGLPTGPRRTPGLRREEVALLAGVSVSWYTWLEQGRDVQASGVTLARVAQVLRLDQVESAYMFALSAREMPAFETDEQMSGGLSLLVHAMNPIAAYVRNTRLDILAWNAAVAELFVDYALLEPHERNTLRLLFLHRPYLSMIVNWADFARGMLSTFRAARARAPHKAPFDRLVDELLELSAEFREWWPDVDVKGFDEGSKRLDHPTLGLLDLTYVALSSERQPDLSITAYILEPRPGVGGGSGGESGS